MRLNIHKLQSFRTGIDLPELPHSASLRYAVWKDAVNHYLKTGDRNGAISYLDSRFNRFAESRFDLIDRMHYLTELNRCIDDYNRMNVESFLRKENFEFSINNGVTVYGQIPRIDKDRDKELYYVTFYIRESMDWKSDIKFKLIQSFCAETLIGTKVSNVFSGVYDLETNKHEYISFSQEEINKAWDEAKEISYLQAIAGNKGKSKNSFSVRMEMKEQLVK
jgi:hypothetical protein